MRKMQRLRRDSWIMADSRLPDVKFHLNHLASMICPQTKARTEAWSEWRRIRVAIPKRLSSLMTCFTKGPREGQIRATVTLRRWPVQNRLCWILSVTEIFRQLTLRTQSDLGPVKSIRISTTASARKPPDRNSWGYSQSVACSPRCTASDLAGSHDRHRWRRILSRSRS